MYIVLHESTISHGFLLLKVLGVYFENANVTLKSSEFFYISFLVKSKNKTSLKIKRTLIENIAFYR